MATTNERKALWFLAFVALSGTGVRLWRANAQPTAPADGAALARQLGRVDSVRAAGPTRRSGGPKKSRPAAGATVPVDLDRASAVEIEALPGIGPAIAARIIANRDSLGAFGTVEALCGVRGVGPALAGRLRPLVTFTGPPRPASVACGNPSRTRKTRATPPRQLP